MDAFLGTRTRCYSKSVYGKEYTPESDSTRFSRGEIRERPRPHGDAAGRPAGVGGRRVYVVIRSHNENDYFVNPPDARLTGPAFKRVFMSYICVCVCVYTHVCIFIFMRLHTLRAQVVNNTHNTQPDRRRRRSRNFRLPRPCARVSKFKHLFFRRNK